MFSHRFQKQILTAALSSAFVAIGSVQAAPLTLTGNFLQVGISDFGTFGSNGSNAPGIRHDPGGAGDFTPGGVANDYLTPGTPHDGYGLRSAETGFIRNDNTGLNGFGSASPTLLVGPAALGFQNAATWSGSNSLVSITNSYFFNDNDERILINSVITALQPLTTVQFVRSTDPDPDVNRFNNFDTNNQRGNALFDPEDFIGSAGEVSGLFLGFLNNSGDTFPHDTRIDGNCCSTIDPNVILTGGATNGPTFPGQNNGDFGLNMAWALGDMATDQSLTVSYFYVFGDNIDTGGGDPVVPEPGVLSLLGLGLLGAAVARRRKTS